MKRFTLKSKHWGVVVVTVDDEDADLLRKMVWTCSGTSRTPVIGRVVKGRLVQLSHAIMDAKKGDWVRHENGCQLDCRKSNLVIETREQRVKT